MSQAIGVILAGGYSSRANGFKLLMDIEGKPVIEHLVETLAPYVTRMIIVTGYNSHIVEEWLDQWKRPHHSMIECVLNPDFDAGMFSSVQVGIHQAVTKMEENVSINRVLLTPGDYPCIRPRTVEQLLTQDHEVVIPSYKMHGGHPICLHANVMQAIIKEPRDSHLKQVLGRFDKHYMDVDDPGILMDVDTPEQMEKARAYAVDYRIYNK